MSKAHLYPYGDKMLTVKEICRLKYPVARPVTVRKHLNAGMSVQEVIDYDVIKAEQLNRLTSVKGSKKASDFVNSNVNFMAKDK
jgi:hypothetical protein